MIVRIDRIESETRQDVAALIRDTDAAYRAQLTHIADCICATHEQKPIVLISGPSGSGKTTTARMLEEILDRRGLESHTLSMDNYFFPLTEQEKQQAACGTLDLESPQRVDTALLNRQLAAMVRGETVALPQFDFVHSRRVDSGKTLTRRSNEIVILEGIHVLNPDVVQLPDAHVTRLYISVRTRVVCEDITLHPSKVRLLRRMLRDRVGRGRLPEETLSRFPSVQRGESRYILPYKHRADFDIDTFIAYELGVYKRMFMEQLSHLHDDVDMDPLLTVLEHAAEIDVAAVPPDSLIREFIGDGVYDE